MEAVSDATDGFNNVGMIAKFSSQRPDMDVDCTFQHQHVLVQRRINQIGSLKDSAWLADQRIQ